jgi:4-hydroxy-3-polyprenylbenzoate decarboxylase
MDLAHCCYQDDDMAAAVSSGSFNHQGMIIAPCSMKTLAAIASSYSDNLMQ